MKKLFAAVVACVMLLTGCASKATSDVAVESTTELTGTATQTSAETSQTVIQQPVGDTWAVAKTEQYVNELNFKGLNDPNLTRYIEDTVYYDLVNQLPDDYFIENIETSYYSKEYLEELEFNSQVNVYFGYTQAELDEQFQGTRYVFTLSDSGETVVQPFEPYEEADNTYNQVMKNVLIGTGVILLCVTVSAVSAGVGAPAISMIFAASAKSATIMGLQTGAISGISAGIVTGIQTGDFDQAVKAGALAGSEGFKWGAITGAITGGVSESINVCRLKGAGVTDSGLTLLEAEKIQKESQYPLDVIRQIHSIDEYNVYKKAGLTAQMIDGKIALMPKIDWNYKTIFPNNKEMTNLQAVLQGYSPFDPVTQTFYNCHHIGQKADATLAVIPQKIHAENTSILHSIGKESEIDRPAFAKVREAFWKSVGKMYQKMLS